MERYTIHKNGFTLSEVLITLGIIGVCAAMILPSLGIDVRNAELQSRLKKTYNTIQNAVLMVAIEDSNFSNSFTGREYKDKFKKHYNILHDCTLNCISPDDIQNRYKTFSNNTIDFHLFDDGQFFIQDGTFIMIENWTPNQLMISADLNGPYKGPNMWGVDIFSFEINDKGVAMPGGTPDSMYADKGKYCSKTSSYGYNGVGCTYYALYDKDYWKTVR